RTIGGAQMQLAGKTRGLVVVLDAADHRMRPAVALALRTRSRAAVITARRRCRLVPVPGRPANRSVRRVLWRCSSGRSLALTLGFGLGFSGDLALALLGLFSTALVLFGQ